MALKDWNLVGRKLGMNHDVTEYYNEKTGQFITFRRGWNIVNIDDEWRNKILIKKVKRESSKIKFAKTYMRTH